METKQERRATFDVALNEAIETGRPDPKPGIYDGDPEWKVSKLFDEEYNAAVDELKDERDAVNVAIAVFDTISWELLPQSLKDAASDVLEKYLTDDGGERNETP